MIYTQVFLATTAALAAAAPAAPANSRSRVAPSNHLARSSVRRTGLAPRALFSKNQMCSHKSGCSCFGKTQCGVTCGCCTPQKSGALSRMIRGREAITAPRAETYPSQKLANLFEGNKKWAKQMRSSKGGLMDKLGKGQEPKIMWIGCSDSRVPENTISQMDPGEIFVVRNVANQVQISDNSVMSAMQFAIGALGVEEIVVCGHYGCGGCKASMANNDHGAPLEQWIADIRNVYRLHQQELDAITDPAQKEKRLIQLNTIEQCLNVMKSGPFQAKRAESGGKIPRVHAAVYDPATGNLENLSVDFDKYLESVKGIYDLAY